jgi:glutamate 5-kinase
MKSSPRAILASVRTLVVKLGTQLLTDPAGQLDVAFIELIAGQVASLRQRGLHVTIVSSGAIGAGLRELKLPARPTDLGKLQAVAAVGQRRLMDVWAGAFSKAQLPVAQVLLTREDIDDRARFLNLRNAINAMHELGAVPIINENDTVSTDELVKISFGDNDILAALVTHALRAELLVLLSVVDGLLDPEGKPIRLVDQVAEKSPLGKGGFGSKLEAARMVSDSGEALVIADGRSENVLPRLLDGDELGTLFLPAGRKLSSRSRWIGSVRPAGTVVVDEGAARALVEQHRSLLPAGIVAVDGTFARGDVVAIQFGDVVIGRGLCNYSAEQVERIRGKHTQAVRELLAESAYDEVIHRDNLVIEKSPGQ